MPEYVVLLHAATPPAAASAHQLGTIAAAMVSWLDELRAAGVLLAAGVPDPELMAQLAGTPGIDGCILIRMRSDDDAHALVGTRPTRAGLRALLVRMSAAPGAEPSEGRR